MILVTIIIFILFNFFYNVLLIFLHTFNANKVAMQYFYFIQYNIK